jgi:hypothetical protein
MPHRKPLSEERNNGRACVMVLDRDSFRKPDLSRRRDYAGRATERFSEPSSGAGEFHWAAISLWTVFLKPCLIGNLFWRWNGLRRERWFWTENWAVSLRGELAWADAYIMPHSGTTYGGEKQGYGARDGSGEVRMPQSEPHLGGGRPCFMPVSGTNHSKEETGRLPRFWNWKMSCRMKNLFCETTFRGSRVVPKRPWPARYSLVEERSGAGLLQQALCGSLATTRAGKPPIDKYKGAPMMVGKEMEKSLGGR